MVDDMANTSRYVIPSLLRIFVECVVIGSLFFLYTLSSDGGPNCVSNGAKEERASLRSVSRSLSTALARLSAAKPTPAAAATPQPVQPYQQYTPDFGCASHGANPFYLWMKQHEGRHVMKWSQYLEVYQAFFSKYRGKEVHLLEIGLLGGGSLDMWKWYFGPRLRLYGIDLHDKRQYADKQTKIFMGDQGNRTFLEEVKRSIPQLDIIIEDGGHQMNQQVATFEVLYPKVKKDGGLYITEDLHTSYWRNYRGGYKKKDSFIEYIKDWIDKMHAHYSQDARLKPDLFTETTNSMHIYDSLVLLQRRPKRFIKNYVRGKINRNIGLPIIEI